MLTIIQRVTHSKVTVNGKTVGEIGYGLNILLGVKKGDTPEDITKLVNKIVNLRIFRDEQDKMNLSLLDVNGEALVISQFTLAGNVKKGRRPSFEESEEPEKAKRLYQAFIAELIKLGVPTQTGEFGAMMEVTIHNDGPVTFILDSKAL